MKKALLYLFTFGLFLSMANHAFSFIDFKKTVENQLVVKEKTNLIKKSSLVFESSDSSLFYNFENDESENLHTSIDKKNVFFTVDYNKNIAYCSAFIGINSLRKNYFSTNFSRLPRFNYITLRILRL